MEERVHRSTTLLRHENVSQLSEPVRGCIAALALPAMAVVSVSCLKYLCVSRNISETDFCRFGCMRSASSASCWLYRPFIVWISMRVDRLLVVRFLASSREMFCCVNFQSRKSYSYRPCSCKIVGANLLSDTARSFMPRIHCVNFEHPH